MLTVALAAACTGSPDGATAISTSGSRSASEGPSKAGAAQSGRTSVTLPGSSARVTVTTPTLTADERAPLVEWGDFPVAVGVPVEVTVDGPLPSAGITITRTYPAPLPADAAATLAYFDPEFGTWVAVASTVSADRRSVSANVHHLSLWTDIVGGVQEAVTVVKDAAASSADWLYYQLGRVFDVRVDPPSCDLDRPDWVLDFTFIAPERNMPVLFCAGQDPNRPDLLAVRARVNRGYGYVAEVIPDTDWTDNSTMSAAERGDILSSLADVDTSFADAFRELTAEGMMVGPGEEISFGVSENSVRALPGGPVLRLTAQGTVPFMLTWLGQLLGADLLLKADGYAAAVVATATCVRDFRDAEDVATLTRAGVSCITSVDEAVARALATYLVSRNKNADPKSTGKLAGKIVGKVTVLLALAGPVLNGLSYFTERNAEEGARVLTVFARPLPKIPGLDVTALSVSTPTESEERQLQQRLERSDFTGGSADDCEYLIIAGWSPTGMDVISGVAGSDTGPECPGDPYFGFQSFRDGVKLGEAFSCDCELASGELDSGKISDFYLDRPVLKVVAEGGRWVFTRTTWEEAVS